LLRVEVELSGAKTEALELDSGVGDVFRERVPTARAIFDHMEVFYN